MNFDPVLAVFDLQSCLFEPDLAATFLVRFLDCCAVFMVAVCLRGMFMMSWVMLYVWLMPVCAVLGLTVMSWLSLWEECCRNVDGHLFPFPSFRFLTFACIK